MGYSPWGCKESDMTERLDSLLRLSLNYHLNFIDETFERGLNFFSLVSEELRLSCMTSGSNSVFFLH